MSSRKGSADLGQAKVVMVESKMDSEDNRLATAQMMSEEAFLDAETRLKRKLDLRLLACVWLIFVMNYLDRNNIAAAKVAGIATSLKLTSNEYATAVAILFAGYVLMQIPSNVFLAHLRPSIYLPTCMAIWGVLSILTGVVQNAAGLYAVRFLLGFVEAAFYRSAFSGLIGAGIQHGLDGARGLEAWRWLFFIEGSITVVIALLSFFVLPDWPSTTRWLSPTERAVAEWRLIGDAGQVDEDDERWSYGFKLTFKDWRVYIFASMFFCLQVASATSNFFPSVVQTLGYGRVTTLLLTAPPYFLGLIISIANNWSADRRNNSSFHVMWPLFLAIIGFVIGAATVNTGARYMAMMLMVAGGHGSNAVVLAWTQKTMLRPRIKRAAAVALVNSIGNISQVWTSYLYPDSEKPRYILAMSVNSVFALVTIFLALVMRILLQRANKKLEAGANVANIMKGEAQSKVAGLSEEERDARKAAFRYNT
ncbi:putative transporter [Tolypocladium ophioglossoides CBS 100239]|uniref:Putative transporter n=1 Tax=Tolypocladium ophioglossoides (strain CBS 100239) TaxID=1163406 RepID=A0A0L0N263_TOLOC|nr:putative transporter [Tolypocladium ophioglossoides CBS 100239]